VLKTHKGHAAQTCRVALVREVGACHQAWMFPRVHGALKMCKGHAAQTLESGVSNVFVSSSM